MSVLTELFSSSCTQRVQKTLLLQLLASITIWVEVGGRIQQFCLRTATCMYCHLELVLLRTV